jgi:sulfur carrier protein
MIRVVLNGKQQELPEALTVAQLVERTAPDMVSGRGIAVAVDEEVVLRSDWERTRLTDGQRVELLAAMQGG